MLSLLHIENIALIEAADISFGSGFNVMTGETGAGKSIVIDAIGALMGERTSRDLIRTGEKSAQVSAVFCALPSLPWFTEHGIEPDENGELLLSRQIQADGKNICRVGGKPCTVVQLKALGRQLINIHGQHDGQQLLDERAHLMYLDSFGGLEQAVAEYRTGYDRLMALRQEIAALHMDEAEKSRRIDTLQFQIGELERAELRPGEVEELAERKKLLRNAAKLMGAVETACQIFSGDEDSDGVLALLGMVEGELHSVSRFSEEFSELAESCSELRYTAEDLLERVRDVRAQFDFSPGELDVLESRLDVLYRLRKKYGDTTEEMLTYLEHCRQELEEIEVSDDTVARLQKKYESLLAEIQEKARFLSQQRKAAADTLKERIEVELQQLDMTKVRFQVEFRSKSGELALDQTGMDDVQFLMSANVGETLKPIQKVASGGELSRIMLALKNVLAENDSVTTLIFDEVDAGVSGRAAQKVAEKMASLAQGKQLLCVTHLPQIAAMADLHFSVQKGERAGRTFTEVETLEREERKQELARLTGGAHISVTMLEGAEELLTEAERFKAQSGG